jgi:hypothetical protein
VPDGSSPLNQRRASVLGRGGCLLDNPAPAGSVEACGATQTLGAASNL